MDENKAVAEGDDVYHDLGKSRPLAEGYDVYHALDQRIATAQEALEIAGLAEKPADENLVTIIAAVPADGPSGILSIVTARRVIHAIEDAGYKITK